MTKREQTIDRRELLQGRILPSGLPLRFHHISSAVVTARPERCEALAREIGALTRTEIHAVAGSKIVVVMEGDSIGEIGSRLTSMALMDGVFSANLVFEQLVPFDQETER